MSHHPIENTLRYVGVKTFTRLQLEAAKRRFLKKCQGSLAVTPIESTNVENILDQFLRELEKK